MHRFAMFGVIVALFLAGACQNKEAETTTTSTLAETGTHSASPGGAALVPDVATGTTVIVTLEDNRIAIQDFDSIPPGPAVFTVSNGGEQTHNLFIEGPGVSKAIDQPLAKDGTSSIEANLQTGTYTLYCPVLNHRENGEQTTLVIRPPGAPAPTSTVM